MTTKMHLNGILCLAFGLGPFAVNAPTAVGQALDDRNQDIGDDSGETIAESVSWLRRDPTAKLTKVFQTTHHSLDDLASQSTLTSGNGQEWQTTQMQLSLALSTSGTMGILIGKGTAAANVLWNRKSVANLARHRPKRPGKVGSVYRLRAHASPREVASTLDHAARAALASGRIQYPDFFKANLRDQVQRTLDLIRLVAIDSRGGWQPTQFQVLFSVAASGMVQPGLLAGGALQLQFSFDFPKVGEVRNIQPLADQVSERQANEVARLTSTIQSEINHVGELEVASNGFVADQIQVSLGISISGDIGVAEVEGQIAGTICYDKLRPVAANSVARLPEMKSITLIKNGLPESAETSLVPSRNLQAGFRRAYQLAQVLTKVSRPFVSRHWELAAIQPAYTLSVGGDLSIVSIEGFASVQINFSKI